jgi:hypothetical protein
MLSQDLYMFCVHHSVSPTKTDTSQVSLCPAVQVKHRPNDSHWREKRQQRKQIDRYEMIILGTTHSSLPVLLFVAVQDKKKEERSFLYREFGILGSIVNFFKERKRIASFVK